MKGVKRLVLVGVAFFSTISSLGEAASESTGGKQYLQSCSSCHGVDLRGVGSFPALVGDGITSSFKNTNDVYQFIRQWMPANAPGTLSDDEYHAIASYISEKNGISASRTEGGILVKINGVAQSYEQAPILKNGSVIVPMRAIFEAIGASVDWNGDTQTVTALKGDKTIALQIGSSTASVDGQSISMNQPTQTVNNHTMVPIRFVSESLGATVGWDADTQTVIISTD